MKSFRKSIPRGHFLVILAVTVIITLVLSILLIGYNEDPSEYSSGHGPRGDAVRICKAVMRNRRQKGLSKVGV